jgi:hypothetical protein
MSKKRIKILKLAPLKSQIGKLVVSIFLKKKSEL